MVAAGTILASGPERGAHAAPASGRFAQGVASGDPKQDSVVLWTRAFDQRQAGLDLPLRPQVATPAGFAGADQWDGFPNRRKALLDAYRELGNVVLITGDIHSSWVTDHSGEMGPLFEFTGTAISSATFSGLILGALPVAASGQAQVQAKAQLEQAVEQKGLLDTLVQVLSRFLIARRPGTRFRPDLEQELKFVDIARDGVVTVTADGASFATAYWLFPSARVDESFYADRSAGLALFRTKRFRVSGGRLEEL